MQGHWIYKKIGTIKKMASWKQKECCCGNSNFDLCNDMKPFFTALKAKDISAQGNALVVVHK